MARINGNDCPDADGTVLSEYIAAEGYGKNRIAVELNGEILPKDEYEKTVIRPEDLIEIVEFMGGG